MSSSVLEVQEEFRKQGGQFANIRGITIQECNGASRASGGAFQGVGHWRVAVVPPKLWRQDLVHGLDVQRKVVGDEQGFAVD